MLCKGGSNVKGNWLNPRWTRQALDGMRSVETCLTQSGGLQLLVSGFGVLLLEDGGGCGKNFILVSLHLVWAVLQEGEWLLAQPQYFLLAFTLASTTPSSSASLQPALNTASGVGCVSSGRVLVPSFYSGSAPGELRDWCHLLQCVLPAIIGHLCGLGCSTCNSTSSCAW